MVIGRKSPGTNSEPNGYWMSCAILLLTLALAGIAHGSEGWLDGAPDGYVAGANAPSASVVAALIRNSLGQGMMIVSKGVLTLIAIPWLIAGLAFLVSTAIQGLRRRFAQRRARVPVETTVPGLPARA